MNNEYNKALNIILNFINEIGIDGESFFKVMKKPRIIYTDLGNNLDGGYVSINSKHLSKIASSNNFSEKEREDILNNGIIEISDRFKNNHNSMFYVTLIHELIHANRDLLLYDYFNQIGKSDFSIEYAYNYHNGKFVRNTKKLSFGYGDASQCVLNGNIDNSYIYNDNGELDDCVYDKMEMQVEIDELLVDIMSIVAYKIYNEKLKGNNISVLECIELLRNFSDNNNLIIMCNIILKHKDYKLFYWLINPIDYSMGDMHFDFFSNYTKDDIELISNFDFYKKLGKNKN